MFPLTPRYAGSQSQETDQDMTNEQRTRFGVPRTLAAQVAANYQQHFEHKCVCGATFALDAWGQYVSSVLDVFSQMLTTHAAICPSVIGNGGES